MSLDTLKDKIQDYGSASLMGAGAGVGKLLKNSGKGALVGLSSGAISGASYLAGKNSITAAEIVAYTPSEDDKQGFASGFLNRVANQVPGVSNVAGAVKGSRTNHGFVGFVGGTGAVDGANDADGPKNYTRLAGNVAGGAAAGGLLGATLGNTFGEKVLRKIYTNPKASKAAVSTLRRGLQGAGLGALDAGAAYGFGNVFGRRQNQS